MANFRLGLVLIFYTSAQEDVLIIIAKQHVNTIKVVLDSYFSFSIRNSD